MKVRYKREMRHNYLILEAFEQDAESFEVRMLTSNSIEGLLKFRMKQEEQNQYYYYEITSKQPLSRLLEFKEIRKEDLGKLVIGIGSALHHMEDFFLQESCVLLEPEHIYIEPDTYQVWLCYVPGYRGDFPGAMEKLLQYLLKKADHRDNDTVVLAYRLYQESQKDYYGMEDLLKAVQESQCGVRQKDSGQDQTFETEEEDHFRQSEDFCSEWESELADREGWGAKRRSREKGTGGRWEEEGKTREEKPKEKRQKAQKQPLEIQEKRKKNQEKERTQDDRSDKKRRSVSRKGTRFAGIFLLVFFVSVPAAVWLFTGTSGLVLYGVQIAAADAGAAAGVLILLIGRRKTKGGEKGAKHQREEWYMTFEEEEAEEISGRGRRKNADVRGGSENQPGSRWNQDSDQNEEWETSGRINWESESGKDQKAKWKTEPEADRNADRSIGRNGDRKEDRSVARNMDWDANRMKTQEQGAEPGKNTVLLASSDINMARTHLLKSLDPSIEDISIPYFPFLIGKQEGIVDYVLKKDTVSRLHVRIDKEESGCRITDLNSSNGTIVAGHNLEANESYCINSGNKLQIADISFVFY